MAKKKVINKNLVAALTLAGMFLTVVGVFIATQQLTRRDPESLAANGRDFLARGETERALQLFMRAYQVSQDPENPAKQDIKYLIEAADALYRGGDIFKAFGALRQANTEQPTRTDVLETILDRLWEFRAYGFGGAFREDERNFAERLAELDPDNAKAHATRAVAYEYFRNVDEMNRQKADEALAKARELDPTAPEVGLADLVITVKRAQEAREGLANNPDAQQEQVEALRKRVVDTAEPILEKHPGAVRLAAVYVGALTDMQRFDEAERVAARTRQANPDSADAARIEAALMETRARQAVRDEDAEAQARFATQARAAAKAALEREPAMLDMYRLLATVRAMEARRDDPAEAARIFDDSLGMFREGFEKSIGVESALASVNERTGARLTLLVQAFNLAALYPVPPDARDAERKRTEWLQTFADLAQQRFPENAFTLYMRGFVKRAANEWAEAIKAFEAANVKIGENIAAFLQNFQVAPLPSENLALLYRQANQIGESLKWTDEAITQYRGARLRPPAALYLNKGEILNDLDRAQEAYDQLTSIRAEYEGDPRIDRVRATALEEMGRPNEAQRVLAQLGDDDPGVLMTQGQVAINSENWELAESKLRAAYELAPGNRNVISLLLQVYDRTDRKREAVALLADARQRSDSAELKKLIDAWEIMLTESDEQTRKQKMEELVRAESDPFVRAVNLYNFHRQVGEMDAARQALDEAERLKPNDAQALELQFGLALSRSDWSRAEQYVIKLANVNADSAGGASYRGELERLRGNLEAARRELETADRLTARNSTIKTRLAQVYVGLQRIEEAKLQAQQAVEINPRDLAARKLLYLIHREQGNDEAASAQLEFALKLNPDDPDLKSERNFIADQQNPVAGANRIRGELEQEPENAAKWARLGELLLKVREQALAINRNDQAQVAIAKAGEAFAKALELAPADNVVLSAATRYFVAASDRAAGEAAFEKHFAAQQTVQGKLASKVALARFYEDLRELDRASAQFEAARQLVASEISDPNQQRVANARIGFRELEFNARVRRDDVAREIAAALLKTLNPQNKEEIPFIREAQIQLARSLLAMRRSTEALPVLDELIKADLNEPNARMLRAEAWLQQGDADKAIEDLSAVLSVRPDHVVVRFTRGDLFAKLRRYRTALEDFQELKKICERSHEDDPIAAQYRMPTRWKLVSIYEIQEQNELAETELRDMLEIFGQAVGAEVDQQATAERLLRLYRKTNKLSRAEQVCAEYMAKYPRQAYWPLQLGDLLFERAQYPAAAERYAQVMSMTETSDLNVYAVAFAKRLRSLVKGGRDADARYLYENKGGEDVLPLVTLAAAEAYPDAATAKAMRTTAIEEAVRRGGAALVRVVADLNERLSASEFVGVMDEVATKLSDPAEVARTRNIQAQRLLSAQQLEDTLPYLEPALKLGDPKVTEYRDALVMRAQTLDRLGRTQEAIQAYEAILAEQPNEVSALNNLAFLLATRADQPQAALQYSQRAINLTRAEAPLALLDTHAWILHLTGADEEAEGRLREALSNDPFYLPALEHLALLLEHGGRKAEAQRYWRSVQEVARRDKDETYEKSAAEALQRLQ